MTTIEDAEPVPGASQLAILPFLAAAEGLMRGGNKAPVARLTVHRVMYRRNEVYLQQVAGYVGAAEISGAGRIFPVDTGIIGAAFDSKKIYHTRSYATEEQLIRDLVLDMKDTNDDRDIKSVALSYTAIPFLGPQNEAVLVLYADSKALNFFTKARVKTLVDLCYGFCRVFDALDSTAFMGICNFPLVSSDIPEYVREGDTVYPRLQMESKLSSPRFERLSSFNFESQV